MTRPQSAAILCTHTHTHTERERERERERPDKAGVGGGALPHFGRRRRGANPCLEVVLPVCRRVGHLCSRECTQTQEEGGEAGSPARCTARALLRGGGWGMRALWNGTRAGVRRAPSGLSRRHVPCTRRHGHAAGGRRGGFGLAVGMLDVPSRARRHRASSRRAAALTAESPASVRPCTLCCSHPRPHPAE